MRRPFPGIHGQSFFVWVIDPATGNVWNTATPGFEAYNSTNYASYKIAATEYGGSGAFNFAVPATLTANANYYVLPWMVGSGVEGGDTPDNERAFGWDGTREMPAANLVEANGAGPVQFLNNLSGISIVSGSTVLVNVTQSGNYAVKDLAAVAQGSTPQITWAFATSQSLAGKEIKLVIYDAAQPAGKCDPFDAVPTTQATQDSTDGSITISGDGNNIVTVVAKQMITATAGHWKYWLLNVSDKLPLATGNFPVRPAVWG